MEAQQHYQRNKSREAREEVLEEFAPDDRERKKKKAGYGQYIAAGHRDEGDMEGLRGNIDLMGGGDDDKRRYKSSVTCAIIA